MEPETSPPKIGPESVSVEHAPSLERLPHLPTPETAIETGAERFEQVAESQAAVADATSTGSPILPSPVIVADEPQTSPVHTAGPMVAADEDLIEKQWVDKAKKIVAETHNDPHQREEAVNQLQRDYLKKRYGRELGEA